MLFMPLQPEIAGVTSQGYRKEGLFILPWGRGDKEYRDTAETDIWEVLKDFDAMFETDKKRQYLYGFSMGGGGALHIAGKSPERWSAIGLYSAAMRNPAGTDLGRFSRVPVWMAWGELENKLTENNRQLKDDLIKAGIEVKWTEVKNTGHNYLGQYQEQLMDWFLQHPKK